MRTQSIRLVTAAALLVVLSSAPRPASAASPFKGQGDGVYIVLPFLSGMDNADYAYRGKGKTTADKDAIVFWYKKAEGTYRAVYGDLSAKDIAEKDVPKD